MVNEILMLAAQDAREFVSEPVEVDCDCNADKACDACIDCGLYDGSEVQPPPLAVEEWNEEDERAMHSLIHCEDESACQFCNPEPVPESKPSEIQSMLDGPKSCEKYYQSCGCLACLTRDRWYEKSAT